MERAAADVLHYEDEELSSGLLLQLNRLRQEGVLTDVLLCSEDAALPCHRAVLVCSSPYFRAMFCSGFVERRRTRVALRSVPPAVLRSIVDYVYTGRVSISADTVLPLMQAASMLQYGRLFEACSRLLQQQMSPDNCLSMMRLSEMVNCRSLRGRAKEMAARSFSDVSASEDLRELSLAELTGFLEDDGLCAGEEQVFETLVSWVHHDPLSRRGAVSDLSKRVRLRHLHPTYLFQFIANDPLIQSSALCTELIDSARRLMFSGGGAEAPRGAPRRRGYRDALVVVGGRKNGEQTSREALVFDEGARTWRRLAKLPLRLYRASYVGLHSVLYVIGGLAAAAGSPRVSAAVYTLSLRTNQWRTAEPMLEPRFAHQAVPYLHFIFVLGGLGPDRRLTAGVERYNSMFNQWEPAAPMPEAVLHPAVAAVNQRIYVFGGEDSMQSPVRIIQVHHVTRNMWWKMENRTVKNACAPAAVVDDTIYIIGGFTRRVIAYDPKANRFAACAGLKARRMHHAAAALHDRLYVTGGRRIGARDVVEDSDGVECYDPKTDAWSSAGTLPFKLFDHGSLTVTMTGLDPGV
ncbi:kelch-like protein 38 [Betta splendens]|uniref:Kelch-like protein 38 n=1 Tax=Betta splendens TaxID=158456 RepID=A0A6P7KV58_BETSP|nr:kelch-like protein 38 [Betta splendens]